MERDINVMANKINSLYFDKSQAIDKLAHTIKNLERNKVFYKENYIKITMELIDRNNELELLKTNTHQKDFIKELTSIADLSDVKDVYLNEENNLIIETNYIHAYTSDNEIIHIGEVIVEIELNNQGNIRIFLANGNKGGYGYWSDDDPHPHVNGTNGKPCLGEVEFALTEAFAKREVFNMVVIMMEWLKSVNKDDSAGKRYIGWDWVDENGEFHEKNNKAKYECYNCASNIDEDDNYYCEECDNYFCSNCVVYIDSEDRYVCETCFEENYHRCKICGKMISTDIIYFNDDGEAYCEDCYHEKYTYCSKCGGTIDRDEAIYDEDDEAYCEDCYNEKYTYCSKCGGEINKDDMYHQTNSGDVCEGCYKEMIEDEKEEEDVI